MLQLPFPATGPVPAAPSVAGSRASHAHGLAQAIEGMPGAFAGELQALLMQLSPPLWQRLDALVAGGMSLPQAAGSLLAGTAGGDPMRRVAALGDDGLAGGLPRGGGGAPAPALRDGPLAPLIGQQPGRGDAAAGFLETLPAAAPNPLAAADSTPGVGRPPLPPQLAGNLLHMGIPQPVGGRGWEGAVADRVVWMVQGEQQLAKLTLNPPNLGPLEIRVAVSNDQTSVTFLAHQAVVRDALEAALPRLRELFEQQSLQLVRADISDPGSRQDRQPGSPSGRAASTADGTGEGADPADPAARPISGAGTGVVDLFA